MVVDLKSRNRFFTLDSSRAQSIYWVMFLHTLFLFFSFLFLRLPYNNENGIAVAQTPVHSWDDKKDEKKKQLNQNINGF